jgi:hypothetical protein
MADHRIHESGGDQSPSKSTLPFANQAMHAKPPIVRFANGQCLFGGSVIVGVHRT